MRGRVRARRPRRRHAGSCVLDEGTQGGESRADEGNAGFDGGGDPEGEAVFVELRGDEAAELVVEPLRETLVRM